MSHDDLPELATNGYIERAILDCLATDGYNTRVCTTAELTRHTKQVQAVGPYAELSARQSGEEDDVARSAVRRAAGRLVDKGLVQRFREIDEEEWRRKQFYTHSGDVRLETGPTDDRVTAWVLTDKGAAEVTSADKRFFHELHELLKRYGRVSPTQRGP